MRIDLAPAKRRTLALTSLIDVVFLLLLFFMLSSTFTRFSRVEIDAGSARATTSHERPDILIRLDGTGWSVNGVRAAEEDALAEIARLEAAGAHSAVILLRGSVTSQALVSAVERIRRTSGIAVAVAR